ncbi:MAG: methyl-accepting chemotaxis protein [Pseudomonadota bacterium]
MSSIASGWTLQRKLLLTLLSVGLLPIVIVATVVDLQASFALESAAYNQLTSIRETKRKHVENYFQSIRDQVLTFSGNRMVAEAVTAFKFAFHNSPDLGDVDQETIEAYRKALHGYYKNQYGAEYQAQNGKSIQVESLIPTEPKEVIRQFHYIAENRHPLGSKHELDAAESGYRYDNYHAQYHPTFRTYLEKFGYYDIFLVDADTGHIIYSVFKELDYATNLNDGPYSDTNFARAFRDAVKATSPDAVFLEDFEPYSPSYEAGASFIASPIFMHGKIEGVLVFQMPVGRINEIMSNNSGLGETGETYLVGGDTLMRSQGRFFDENTIGKTRATSPTILKALEGSSGAEFVENYRNVKSLSAYSPISIEGLEWAIIAEMGEDEALTAVTSLQYSAIAIGFASMIGIVAIALFFVRRVMAQLGADPRDLQHIAQSISSGDLDIAIDDTEAKGVFAEMVAMRDNLRNSIERDRTVARETARLKQALDSVLGNVMVTDADHSIIYANDALMKTFMDAQSDLRAHIPHFDVNTIVGMAFDDFHAQAQHSGCLVSLTTTHEATFEIGARNLTFAASAVKSESGERLGSVIEWWDRTTEVKTENEIEQLISAAQSGDLSRRMDLSGKEGFFRSLSQGMNQLVSVIDTAFTEISHVMGAIAQGDLQQEIKADYQGQFGEVKANVNGTINQLRDTVLSIRDSVDEITTGSDEISTGNNNLSSRTEQQAASLEKTASSMEELTSTVRHNADNAQQANQLATGARQTAEKGGEVVGRAVTAMSEINEASNKIAEIIGVIDEIAFQTNLLALNASVEAARAGEQGRGFAVVATEVRNLAQRSATSAREIKELIQDSVEKVDAGAALVNESGMTLEEIVNAVKKVGDIVADIAAASQEQAAGIDQVNQTVTSMDELTQQNAALAEETSAASVSMSQQARDMSAQVAFFKVGQQSGSHMSTSGTTVSSPISNPVPVASSSGDNWSVSSGSGSSNAEDEWAEF